MKIFGSVKLVSLFLSLGVILSSCGGDKSDINAENIVEVKIYDLKDFFKNPVKSSYQISPNGQYYSYMAPFENRMNVFIQKVGEPEGKRITEVTDRDIAGYLWLMTTEYFF